MTKPNLTRLQVGDKVGLLDTANDKELEAFIRQLDGGKVQVYVTRFKTTMWLDQAGQTRLGRFKLLGHRA